MPEDNKVLTRINNNVSSFRNCNKIFGLLIKYKFRGFEICTKYIKNDVT